MGHKRQEMSALKEQPSVSDKWELKDKFSIFLAPVEKWEKRERVTSRYFP